MRDLELWQGLSTRSLTDTQATEGLTDLAQLPPARRVAYWGVLEPYLSSSNPTVRRAAVLALTGARGYRAFQELVRLLDDPEESIRNAAVAALRESTDGPGRWAHVLYHANAQVRRKGLEATPGGVPPSLPLSLLADPATSDLVCSRLSELTTSGEVVPFLIDLARASVLPVERLRELLVADWIRDEPHRFLDPLPVDFGFPRARSSLSEMRSVRDAFVGSDALDEVLELFWPADEAFFCLLGEAMRHERLSEEHERRLAWALARVARDTPDRWSAPRLALLASVMPVALSDPDIPLATRQGAARMLAKVGGRSRASDPFKDIGEGPVLMPGGALDLVAASGVASRAEGNAYALMDTRYGSRLERAVSEDLDTAIELLALNPTACNSVPYRRLLYAWFSSAPSAEQIARLALTLNRDAFAFIAGFQPNLTLEITRALLVTEQDGRLDKSASRRKHVLEQLADPLAAHCFDAILEELLQLDPLTEMAVHLLFEVASRVHAHVFSSALARMDTESHHRFINAVEDNALLPLSHLRAAAMMLRASAHPTLNRWATRVLDPPHLPRPISPLRGARGKIRSLTRKERIGIVNTPAGELSHALEVVYEGPLTGISDALAARSSDAEPHVEVCAALLLCHDRPEHVAKLFPLYAADRPEFWKALNRLMVDRGSRSESTPWLGCAWLYLWERRLFQFLELSLQEGGLGPILQRSLGWPGGARVLKEAVWAAVARMVGVLSARDRSRLHSVFDAASARYVVDALPEMQVRAAAILVQLHRARFDDALLDELKSLILPALGRLDFQCQKELSRWLDVEGSGRRRRIAAHKNSGSVDSLIGLGRTNAVRSRFHEWLCHPDRRVVDEALLRLATKGDEGRRTVLDAFRDNPPYSRRIAARLREWPDGEAIERAKFMTGDASLSPRARFDLALALLWRGEVSAWEACCGALCTEPETEWVRPTDFHELTKAASSIGKSADDVAEAVVESPYSAIYTPALTRLLGRVPIPQTALRRFLAQGTDRLTSLRTQVARRLHQVGDSYGLPLLIDEGLAESDRGNNTPSGLLKGAPPETVTLCGRCYAMAGTFISSKRLLDELDTAGLDPRAQEEAWSQIVQNSTDAAVHERVFSRMRLSRARDDQVQHLAEIFAWGVLQGVRLTWRKFSIRMIGGEAFANTRLTSLSLNINPLPLLRGEKEGQAVVEGLILHELGHHVYHASSDSITIWNNAQARGVHQLLNLVADEHLERNIRAQRESDGNALKALATYAFQRKRAEVPITTLLSVLGSRTFDVLRAAKLEVGRNPHRVVLRLGETLRTLEAQGSSFTRFFRALRMGLGNRHDDPKVARALALFSGPAFRRSSMEELWSITEEIQRIFGDETKQLGVFDQHTEWGDETESRISGNGISDDEVQRAVKGILDRRTRLERRVNEDANLSINLGGEESFYRITTLQHVAPNRDAHRLRVRQVAPLAKRLRASLESLGLSFKQHKGRVRGGAADRSRIKGMLLQGDPRILRARQIRRDSDLFLGVVIDCSGSMGAGNSMEKAMLFGVLLAEATKGMRNVDTRFWGFTDRVILEAGDAHRCAVTSLRPIGGNNDAAALHHAGQAALKSKRRARLLVMISDGAPTECTAESLRMLVRQLTRRHNIACAQVAVRPIDEMCFPNYVEILEGELETAVRRFARVTTQLVGRALGR